MTRQLLVAAVMLSLASPALAAEYYLMKNTETGKCDIGNRKPEGDKFVMVGTKAYATEAEAKTARKEAKKSGECKTGEKEPKGEGETKQ